MRMKCFLLLIMALTALTPTLARAQQATPKPAKYINPDAPEVKIPPYRGQNYEAIVPDTLDLAERARLSIRGLTNSSDPDDDYSVYWLVNFHNNPPMMKKETYPTMQNKFMESLPLLRIMSGSQENSHVDQFWMNQLVKSIAPAGNVAYPKGPGFPSRMMNAMILYYMRDGDPAWKKRLEAMIDHLCKTAMDKGDWAWVGAKDKMPKTTRAIDGGGTRFLQTFGHYYALTGYAPAKELGDKLANYLIKHSEYFGPNGEWLYDQMDPEKFPDRVDDNHFGTHSHALLYLTDYAVGTKNKELLEYCKKSCDWGLHRNTTIEGQCPTATRIGFFLEYLNPYYPTAEECSIADITPTALKLSQAGVADYWDQLDGWIRNHFAENQILNSDWISHLASPAWPRKPDNTWQPIGSDETDDRVAERKVGNFFSWPSANDGCPSRPVTPNEFWACPIGIMECCGGNGSRALYHVWEHIMIHKDGGLKINFLLNRASKWADLDSYIPYTGRVDLKVKKMLKDVTFRAPSWIETGDKALQCTVNGKVQAVTWAGRYVSVGKVKPRDVVRLTFPIEEKTILRKVYGGPLETVIGGMIYDSITFRGNEVVDIQPEGKNYPFYQRDHYRSETPRLRTVQRFVSDEEIMW